MLTIGNIQLPDFPILLAPMEDVSDPPFRQLCKEQGVDLMFSEFISSEGLIRDAIKSKQKLDFIEAERPIGIQIFGGDAEAMSLSAKIVEAVQPNLIDINFGCPVKKVVTKGAGAAVLKDCPLMIKLTKEVIKSTHLPVTVKTRLGWDDQTINVVDVVEQLQDIGVKAITIHARTRQQMYKGKANWDWFYHIKNNPRITIPIFGNGDVDSALTAFEYKNKYPVDGIMIGRAAIGYPWIFKEVKHYLQHQQLLPPPSLAQRVEICHRHLQLSIQWKGEKVGIHEMRKHYNNYFKNISNFKEFRMQLVTANSYTHLNDILQNINAIQQSV